MTGYVRVVDVTALLKVHATHVGESKRLSTDCFNLLNYKMIVQAFIIILLMNKYIFHLCYK